MSYRWPEEVLQQAKLAVLTPVCRECAKHPDRLASSQGAAVGCVPGACHRLHGKCLECQAKKRTCVPLPVDLMSKYEHVVTLLGAKDKKFLAARSMLSKEIEAAAKAGAGLVSKLDNIEDKINALSGTHAAIDVVIRQKSIELNILALQKQTAALLECAGFHATAHNKLNGFTNTPGTQVAQVLFMEKFNKLEEDMASLLTAVATSRAPSIPDASTKPLTFSALSTVSISPQQSESTSECAATATRSTKSLGEVEDAKIHHQNLEQDASLLAQLSQMMLDQEGVMTHRIDEEPEDFETIGSEDESDVEIIEDEQDDLVDALCGMALSSRGHDWAINNTKDEVFALDD